MFNIFKINNFLYESIRTIIFNISVIFLITIIYYIFIDVYLIKSDFLLFIILIASVFAYYFLDMKFFGINALDFKYINNKNLDFPFKFNKNKIARIGIYGPHNAGKTTLANRIIRDWTGDAMVAVSEFPHEIQRTRRLEGVTIELKSSKVILDIVDTPRLATNVNLHFMAHGLEEDEEETKRRAKEATEGILEAVKWLDSLDGVIIVMDATEDPFVPNVTVISNMEVRSLPIIIVANKIDLPESLPARISSAFPQYPMVSISALKGKNLNIFYREILEYFNDDIQENLNETMIRDITSE